MITFPDVQSGESMVISATTFMAYRNCPASAVARLRGEYGPDSRPAFRGGLAHRMFARHLDGGEIAPADFEQACREEIGTSMNPKIGDLKLKPSELRGLISEVGELYERFKRLPTEGFRAAEVQLQVEPIDGVTMRGSIDAVFDGGDRGVRLIDWKTGQLGDPSDQLAFYSLLWALQHHELPGAIEAMSVKTGERSSEVPTWDQANQTAAFIAEAVNVARAAFSGGVEAELHGGPWCRYCPLVDTCPEGAAATSVLGI